MVKVIIGIQARSTSTRFPGKVFELIDNKEILQHIIDSAKKCAVYLMKDNDRYDVKVVVLIPSGDSIYERYLDKVIIFEGSEEDVLSRYYDMAASMKADYIVRLTSDCPLLPPFVITKHINVAVNGRYDYVSNVHEALRTAVDGHDCEVLSMRALTWAHTCALNEYDREHVTPVLRTNKAPEIFKTAHLVGYLFQPHIKLSVDTREDLERVKREYSEIKLIIDKASVKNGKTSVHRF